MKTAHNKKLVLLTNGFPFGYGETFLEAEIKHIEHLFDDIVFMPIFAPEENVRKVPVQSTVILCNAKSSLKNKLSVPLLIWKNKALFVKMIKDEKKTIKTIYKSSLKGKRKKLLHDIIKGFQYFDFIQKNIAIDTGTIFYSYWLSNPALGLSILKYYYPWANCIARGHRWDLYFEGNKDQYISFQPFKANYLNRVYFIAEQGRTYFSNRVHFPVEKLFLSKLGTRTPLPKSTSSGLNQDEKTIISCSNLFPNKRVQLLIEGLKTVKTPIKWIHIGTGPLMPECNAKAAELLAPRESVRYQFLGQLTNIQVHEFYATNDVDLFINVSSSEGLPVSLMEAISYGIPIMATDVGGTAEICHRAIGRLLPDNITASQLADEIDSFFQKREPIDSNIIFDFWKNNFSAQTNFKNFGQSLMELID